jgi:hypothetical protein
MKDFFDFLGEKRVTEILIIEERSELTSNLQSN